MLIPVILSIFIIGEGKKIYWLGISFLVYLGGCYLMVQGINPIIRYTGVFVPFILLPAAWLVRKQTQQSNQNLKPTQKDARLI